MFTAAAGLISAITGLVVAVEQLRPKGHAAATVAGATSLSAPATVSPTVGSETGAGSLPAVARPTGMRVSFLSGRHAEPSGGMRYDVLSATVRAPNPGQLELVLRVRVTNPGRYDGNFWSATFRLRTGANTSAPTNFLDDLVHGGTTDTGEVDFTLPATTRKATLLIGDDPTKAIPLPIRLTGGSS